MRRWTSVCVLANDLTGGGAVGPVSTHECSQQSRATNSWSSPRSSRPCERKNNSEQKLGLAGWSDRSPAVLRSSRWVQLSRRVNLKWTRRDGTLTFNIRGARKSGPTARRPGLGKLVVIRGVPAARERAWSLRSSCFDSLRARSTQDDRSSRPSENSMRSKSSRSPPSGEPVDLSSAPNGFRETRLSQQTRFPRRKSANFVVVWPAAFSESGRAGNRSVTSDRRN